MFQFLLFISVLINTLESQNVSECLNDKEFLINNNNEVKSVAEIQCINFSETTSLATIKDLETFNFLTQFARSIFPGTDSLLFHFGLERKSEGDSLDPLSFEFADKSTFNEGFGDVAGVLPWREGEPNDLLNNENCVEFEVLSVSSAFNDIPCDFKHISICERPCSAVVELEEVFPKKEIFLSGAVVSGVLFTIFTVFLVKKKRQEQNSLDFSIV